MGSIGSPFDAPLPRFQQAAANLAGTSKKPPLSPELNQSLRASGSLKVSPSVGSVKPDDYTAAEQLAIRSNSSNTRRRAISAHSSSGDMRADLLAAVKEGEEQELLGGAPATSLHEKAPCNPEKEHMFLMKSVSLPSNMLLSKAVSLSMPCPTSKEGRRLWARLPSILASLAVIALVVLSTVALCRSRTAGPVTSAAAQLPRKFLSKLFQQDGYVAVRMEEFTAAQGSGVGTGFGLQQMDLSPQASPGHQSTSIASDFQTFMATHLGWGQEAPKTPADAEAEFQHAEAVNAHAGHAGGFGPGLVTITSTKSISFPAAAAQQPPKKLEGRRELETGGSAAAPATSLAAKRTGPIPIEPINNGQQLSSTNAGGFLAGSKTPTATTTSTPTSTADSSHVASTESINSAGQLSEISAESSTVGGTNLNGGTAASSGSSTIPSTTSGSRIGPIMAGGTTTTSMGSAQAGGGINTASSTRQTSSTSSAAMNGAGSKASGLRKKAAAAGTGSKVGSNQPLETVNAGSSSSVDAPVEVDLTG